MINFKKLFKQKQLLLYIITGILLISTIILSILYSIQRNKIIYNQTNDLCLSPYCIKAG